jgi:uncharacterized RDD family membrane protein YckC
VPRQCSENRCLVPVDSLDPRSWPRRRSGSSKLEEKPGHGPDPRFLSLHHTEGMDQEDKRAPVVRLPAGQRLPRPDGRLACALQSGRVPADDYAEHRVSEVVAVQNRRLIGAGVGRRAAAVIVDLVVMSPALFLVARVFGHSTMVVTPAGRTYNYTMDLSGLVFSMLVIVVYHIVLEGLFGRTVGKLVTGLVVVKDDGSPVDLGAALVRNLLRVVDGFFFYLVAAIAVWASPTHQRFGDKAAHTMVVRRASQPVVLPAAPPPRPDAWTARESHSASDVRQP